MIRKVNFYNEIEGKWNFEVNVKILKSIKDICFLTDVYIGEVEYTDGSWLEIYNSCGVLVGVEYKEN